MLADVGNSFVVDVTYTNRMAEKVLVALERQRKAKYVGIKSLETFNFALIVWRLLIELMKSFFSGDKSLRS